MKKSEFLELPEIQKWQKATSNNTTQFRMYLHKLLIICNTNQITISDILDTDNHLYKMIEIYNNFKQKVAQGEIVHTRNVNDSPTNFTKYATALKSFFGSQGFYIPPKFEFEQRKGLPNYAEIELTDAERDQGLVHFGGLGDPKLLQAFALQSEIFCRISALLEWKNNLEIRDDEVDGIPVKYGYINKFYEPKQHTTWNKRVLNKGILDILEDIPQGEPIFADATKDYKEYCDELRVFYRSIGKIRQNEKSVKQTDSWYYDNYPTHSVRHSSTRQALRRTGGNYSIIASMGWNSEGIVRQIYSKPDEELVLRQSHCEYCNPPKFKLESERFCTFEHFLAYQYNDSKPKSGINEVDKWKKIAMELRSQVVS
jgi:hypothetical protein